MFYSHEVLTNRKYGVATIWLVATLGSKSNLKKVTRRAILDVDLSKACRTITEPEAPLALRLQGSLLYGVSRVYSQQCGYVLADVTSLRDKMRGTEFVLKAGIDPEVGNARSEQLNIADDPGFVPDFDLSFDLSFFGFTSDESRAGCLPPTTLASSQTSLGIHDEEEEDGGINDEFQLTIPSYHTPEVDFDGLDLSLGAGTNSAIGTGSKAQQDPPLFDSEPAIADDWIFDIDDDGALRQVDNAAFQDQIHDDAAAEQHAAGDFGRIEQHGTEPQSVPEQDHRPQQHLAIDQDIVLFDDNQPLYQNPSEDTSHQLDDDIEIPPGRHSTSSVHSPDEITETAVAPQRRARPDKSIKADKRTELSNRDLHEWNENYIPNMRAASRLKEAQISRTGAKRYAEFWSVGQGIGRVAFAFGDDNRAHPFAVFSGQSLWEMLKGPESRSVTKRSRSRSDEDEGLEGEGRNVRARTALQQDARSAEGDTPMLANGDDMMIVQGDDFNIESEVGRHAPPSLRDHSSGMPWNISASRQSSVQPLGSALLPRLSSSVGGVPSGFELGHPSALGRRGSYLTSTSPLFGKGLSRLASQELLDPLQLTSIDDAFGDLDQGLGVSFDADYELYGPSATVDTQLAVQSQWVTATLENEAYNFLTFVNARVQEIAKEQGSEVANDQVTCNSISFSQLLPPAQNSQVVGAQGLLHVLALATKGLIEVYQGAAFGEIEMAIAGHNEEEGGG